MKSIKEICDEDNKNQKAYRLGLITKKHYEELRDKIHNEYILAHLPRFY